MKKFFVFGFVLALSLTWAAALPAQQMEKIKIGILGPMSGAGAAWGINMQRGASLAIEDINKAGGIKVGNKTYQFEMVPADDKYTGAVAVSEGSRLIFEQKIKYVFGPIGSSPTVAFSPLMNDSVLSVRYLPETTESKLTPLTGFW